MTAMKKIELHLHIEGAAPPALIRSLAAEKKQDLSGIFDAQGAYSYSGFNDFLRVYEAATSVLTTPRDYARLLTEVLAEAAAHGAVYAELFVSPEFCGGADLSAWRDYLAAMEEAALAAVKAGGKDGPPDLESFQKLAQPVMGTCKDCHKSYRTED